jgi:hypothetical protein
MIALKATSTPEWSRSGGAGYQLPTARRDRRPLRAHEQTGAVLWIHGYGSFLAAGVLLNLTPGQYTMFIIGQSLTGGTSRIPAFLALGARLAWSR